MVHAADPDSTTFNEFIEHTKLNGHGIQELSSRKPSNASAIDKRDMWRMGKVQELRRYFGPWAIIGFASILGCAWEYALITVIFSLPNKGPAGAAYMFLACCVGLMPATLSLAEMSSMAPSAGGQYHWISEFAPRNIQKLPSYLVGWLTVFG